MVSVAWTILICMSIWTNWLTHLFRINIMVKFFMLQYNICIFDLYTISSAKLLLFFWVGGFQFPWCLFQITCQYYWVFTLCIHCWFMIQPYFWFVHSSWLSILVESKQHGYLIMVLICGRKVICKKMSLVVVQFHRNEILWLKAWIKQV